MAVQFTKSEQINSCMQMVMDYDQKFTKREEFLNALQKALGQDVTLIKYQGTKDVYLYKCGGVNHYIMCASVTYLGNPHPLFKKRMQLKKWYKDFYREYENKPNTTINLIGIYHYDGVDVYCDFNIVDYIGRKLNSSSAHVYINDIYQAMKEGSFDNLTSNVRHITHIVRYFEANSVNTVCENSTYNGNYTVCITVLNFNAVNVCLC